MFLPLATEINTTKAILGSATSAMGTMQGVGIGIASLFLLFVVFKDISSLLDGGKFQIKMLGPLVIYLCVANFNLVASPVVSFISSLQSRSMGACAGYKAGIIKDMTNGAVTDGTCSYWDAFKMAHDAKNPMTDKKTEDEMSGEDDIIVEQETTDDNKSRWNFSGIVSGIRNTVSMWWEEVKHWFVKSITKPIGYYNENDGNGGNLKWGLLGLVAAIFSWIAEFVNLALSCMGSVMTGLIIAFGPITWAFALIPGNGKHIVSWFLRLCQFALYGPIASLISSFVVTCLFKVASGDASGSITVFMGVILCNIACLASVPSIASMIIEGASGGVTIGGGMQAVSQAVSSMEGVRDRRALATEKEENKILKSIDKALGGESSKGAEGAGGPVSGQNPFKNKLLLIG